MADKKQVALLKQGVKEWDAWRRKNPNIEINLTRADLVGAVLSKVLLDGANLSRADLTAANLSRALLVATNLAGADLSGANLSEALLEGANLTAANLDCAEIYATVFGATDLTGAKNLASCFHRGPSILDHQTLLRSGRLPLEFLRGCGLPDTLINYLPSLLNEPIQFYSCFISHSSKDHEFANRLYADLQNNAVIEKWECFDADTKKDLATEIREYYIPDFSNWKNHDAYQKAFDRLLRDLKAEDEKRKE